MGKAVSLKLDDRERARLAALAEKKKRSAHFLMREAVVEFIEREENRLAFFEEAEEAWKDYKETGQYLTLDDMEKWAKASGRPMRSWRKS
jgi:predicted transcriptional regulator